MNHSIVSPAVENFARRLQNYWRKTRPVEASLWGPLQIDGFEDLSDAGLVEWVLELKAFKKEAALLESHAVTVADHVLLQELRRVINSKLYQEELQRPFDTALAPYLSLIGASILPFVTNEPPSEFHEVLEARLVTAHRWLEVAEYRLVTQPFLVTGHDSLRAEELAAALRAFEKTTQWFGHKVHAALNKLHDKLMRWTGVTSIPNSKPQDLDIEALIANGLGQEWPVERWQETIVSRLEHEVDLLSKAIKMGGTLQELAQRADWDPFGFEGWEAGLDSVGSGSNRNLQDPFGVMEWLQFAYDSLLEQSSGQFFRKPVTKAPIHLADPVAATFIPEALFLFDGNSPTKGEVLISPQLLARDKPMSWRFRAYVALILAHELCPGHHVQALHSSDGPLAPFLDLLHSLVGMEGWAVYAERIVAQFGTGASVVAHFHTIRRLMPAAVILTNYCKGNKAAQKLIKDTLHWVPTLRTEQGLSSLGYGAFPYAFGLVETERALDRIVAYDNEGDLTVARQTYLNQGFISPAAIVQLATRRLL